jgi:hypothetical protein
MLYQTCKLSKTSAMPTAGSGNRINNSDSYVESKNDAWKMEMKVTE